MLLIVCAILLLACIFEFIVLVKDKGRFARCLNRANELCKEKGFFRMLARAFPFVFRISKRFFSKLIKKQEGSGLDPLVAMDGSRIANADFALGSNPSLAIFIGGGYGDYLLAANWIDYLKRIIDENVCIDIFYESKKKKSAFSIFTIEDVRQHLLDEDEYRSESYLASIFVVSFPILKHGNEQTFKEIAPKLAEYILRLRQFNDSIRFECDLHPFLDCKMSARGVIYRKKRIASLDFDNLLGMTEDYIHKLPVEEDEEGYLCRLALEKNRFILVHRGWDASGPNVDFNVKGWSLKSCAGLMEKLKSRFSDYKIVLFGADSFQAPPSDGCDLNLIGKTSMEQVKVLLRNAACLVDNEGGMVHLRHALHGGISVVLFGPTSPDFFGYSENINIRSNVCKQWCEWISSDWASKCIRTGRQEAPCMEAITTEDVVKAVEKVLL